MNELKTRGGRIGAALIALDLEKAYDYVDRDSLWTIMDTFGYSRHFVNKLKTLYNMCGMQIMNGGTNVGLLPAQTQLDKAVLYQCTFLLFI